MYQSEVHRAVLPWPVSVNQFTDRPLSERMSCGQVGCGSASELVQSKSASSGWTGRAASSKSPLDHIRPTTWPDAWSDELVELVSVLTQTIELLPQGTALLERICDGPLIRADELPPIPAELREPPRVARLGQSALGE
jgi:hypothetical protein